MVVVDGGGPLGVVPRCESALPPTRRTHPYITPSQHVYPSHLPPLSRCRKQPPPAPNHARQVQPLARSACAATTTTTTLAQAQYYSLSVNLHAVAEKHLSAGRKVSELICQSLQEASLFSRQNPKAIPRHANHDHTPSFRPYSPAI
ncbi:hypothetical protein M409DRAFT_60605 [Zasmidium cellare ATCC 36951]|uniref:Uncharacterized protein n=1 Tax=Zasmidium cellare ATCC 36951 TaxID=1080233 RepID=A0A6A6BY04_ZASCE|nr:uncharacterized protein M409DRAFT_60605 [Zasmidium cellare ATCC 36951]KAF2159677.1 hypothetical protein M409DRAFT_60605 [Zasmidium cellare ATCC 36951]